MYVCKNYRQTVIVKSTEETTGKEIHEEKGKDIEKRGKYIENMEGERGKKIGAEKKEREGCSNKTGKAT